MLLVCALYGWQEDQEYARRLMRPDRETNLLALLGEHADVNQSAELAFEVSQEEAGINPSNDFRGSRWEVL